MSDRTHSKIGKTKLSKTSILNCFFIDFVPIFHICFGSNRPSPSSSSSFIIVAVAVCMSARICIVHLTCSTPICVVEPTNLGQFGIYNLMVNQTGCSFETQRSPVHRNWCKYMNLICNEIVIAHAVARSGNYFDLLIEYES